MKKGLILSIIFMVAGYSNAMAQMKYQTATLQHNGHPTVFYGVDALGKAHEAANDNDTILLSSGSFNTIGVNKNISIIGVGSVKDDGDNRTVIGFGFESPYNTGFTVGKTSGVHLEGLYLNSPIRFEADTISNCEIVKCQFQWLYFFGGFNGAPVNAYNCTIRQCAFWNIDGHREDHRYLENWLISNCFIQGGVFVNTDSSILFDHCIIRLTDVQYQGSLSLGAYNYTNNTIYGAPSPAARTSHNVFIGTDFQGEHSDGDWSNVIESEVFISPLSETYSDNMDFTVKSPTFVAEDGTPVGVQGGNYKWNFIPEIPRITYSSIDTSNIKNGTIKINLKAETSTQE